MTEAMPWLGLGAAVCAVAALVAGMLSLQREAHQPQALAGRRRREALESSLLFALLLPFIQVLAVLVRPLPIHKTRERYRTLLTRAGHPAGLMPDELVALQILASLVLPLALGFASQEVLGYWHPAVWLALPIGFLMPPARFEDRIKQRVGVIERRLPYALDLIIVCAEAGCSFEEAVFRIVDANQDRDPLTEELRLFRQELELVDMRTALQHFADRVPSGEVSRLVHAILEGERQGTPYKDILAMARDMMRSRQSNRIEKAAARAQQLLIIPTLLITGAVLVMLVGGMILRAYLEAGKP